MRRNAIIEEVENAQLKDDVPEFGPGDTVVVQVRVREGSRERLQAFEGVVIGKRNRGLNSAFTVRKISHGVGVERTFQTHSPMIAGVRRQAPRRRAQGQALLPARTPRPGGSDSREDLRGSTSLPGGMGLKGRTARLTSWFVQGRERLTGCRGRCLSESRLRAKFGSFRVVLKSALNFNMLWNAWLAME